MHGRRSYRALFRICADSFWSGVASMTSRAIATEPWAAMKPAERLKIHDAEEAAERDAALNEQ